MVDGRFLGYFFWQVAGRTHTRESTVRIHVNSPAAPMQGGLEPNLRNSEISENFKFK